MRTYTPKPGEVTRAWHVIDATDVVLGRLASQTAVLLRGKHKPTFAPHVDTGDFVIIINDEKVALTGNKAQLKRAYRHSGFPGGLSSMSYAELLDKDPRRAIEKAVRGMLPKNCLLYTSARWWWAATHDALRKHSRCTRRCARTPGRRWPGQT